MTLLRGITILDLIDDLPPELRGFVAGDIAGFFEQLSIVKHHTLTTGTHYIHHGIIQAALQGSLALPRGFPVEFPGLTTGLRFQFSSIRAVPSESQNLEPQPTGWQLDLFVERIAVPVPGLVAAQKVPRAPSQPPHLVPAAGNDKSVKFYGRAVIRLSSGADGINVDMVAAPDPFAPDRPTGAILKLGLSPPHALFGEDSNGFGMSLGEVTIDGSDQYTPPEVMARMHGPEWMGFAISEAAVFLPRGMPALGDVSLGVKDLLIGIGEPGGVQLEAWLALGRSTAAASGLQFFQAEGEELHGPLPSEPVAGESQRIEVSLAGTPSEIVQVRAREGGDTPKNARWKRPGDSNWSTGPDTGWFSVHPGGGEDNVLHYRELSTGEDEQEIAGEEVLIAFTFGESDPALAHPPTINVEHIASGTSWNNVTHLSGSSEALSGLRFHASAPGSHWELHHAGNTTPPREGDTFEPGVVWQVGEHSICLQDANNHVRRVAISVLEQGELIVGSEAGVAELDGAITAAAVVASSTAQTFHASGRLDGNGTPATLEGTLSVPAGTIAEVSLERGTETDPDEPSPPPAEPPVAHYRLLMDYGEQNVVGEYEIRPQQLSGGGVDPWGPEPFSYPARDPGGERLGTRNAWVQRMLAIDPNMRFVVIGRTCDLARRPGPGGAVAVNRPLSIKRAKAAQSELLRVLPPEYDMMRITIRGELDPDGPTLPAGDFLDAPGARSLASRALSPDWEHTRFNPAHHGSDLDRARAHARGADIYALLPESVAEEGTPDPEETQHPARRRSLVPGPDPSERRDVETAEPSLNYALELRAKWDSPTWVDERDSIPVLVELTFDWTDASNGLEVPPVPDGEGGELTPGPIQPVDPNTGSSPDNYRFIARFTFDPRSGQAVMSASLDSPGDENGLAKFVSDTDDPDDIAGKMVATALALGPALMADVSTASDESKAVRITALLAAIVAATALDIVQEGSVTLHRVEIEHMQRDLGNIDDSRFRVVCDYVVELKCSCAMFGVESEDPIKLRYKNVGFELDNVNTGTEKFSVIYEEADFEVVNPGKWKVNGWLGQLLGITAVRLGTGSIWFELDMDLSADLGVIEISRATIRITISGGNVSVDLRGLAASVDIPGTVKGAGSLQIREGAPLENGTTDTEVSASLDLTIIPADIRAYAALAMQGNMVHLEAGLRFATAIPLGGTGFGIYGFSGRFVSNGTRNLDEDLTDPVAREMAWYGTEVTNKYTALDGQYAIGLGVVVGTMPDAGFTFNAEGMLTFEFPDPSVVLTIDASLMNPPSGEASEQGDTEGGGDFSLKLLGLIAISEAGLAIGVSGKFTIPEVVEASIPFAAWFPFQASPQAAYLRVGSDGHNGRAGEPISVKILPKVFDLRAWAFFMVEELELLELGKHPAFNFHGFSIGFGSGFTLKWGDDAIRLEVTSSILAGFGTRPFTLMAGIFLKGELWLVIVGLSVEAELILRVTEDAWDLRGKVCGKVSLLFFTVEGCIDFYLGEEPAAPPPPSQPLITGVQLTDKRARVLADAVAEPAVGEGEELPPIELTHEHTAWPDTTIVIHFAHTVVLDLGEDSIQSTPTTTGAGWGGTERLKYLYVLRRVEILDLEGNPVELRSSEGDLTGPEQWPSVWWMPAFRPGLPEEGESSAGEHEGWDLGVLKWDPAPWSRALPGGGEGLASDPATVLPRACDDPPQPSVHCVFGSLAQRTGVDTVELFGPVGGTLPYRSNFFVRAREGFGDYGVEALSELLLHVDHMTLEPSRLVTFAELPDPEHEHTFSGAWQLPYLLYTGILWSSLAFYADYIGPVRGPDLVLSICVPLPPEWEEQQQVECCDFADFEPNKELAQTITVGGVVFSDFGGILSTVDMLPYGVGDGVSELNFSNKGIHILLPEDAIEVTIKAAWFDGQTSLLIRAYSEDNTMLGSADPGVPDSLQTYTITAAGIRSVVIAGGNSTGVIQSVCYKTQGQGGGDELVQQVLNYLQGASDNLDLDVTHAPSRPQGDPLPMPLVNGRRPDGNLVNWPGTPFAGHVHDHHVCLFVRYEPTQHLGPYVGFEVLPFPRFKVAVVSTCGISQDAFERAQEDAAVRETLHEEISEVADGPQDARVILLDADTIYRVRVTYDEAIWVSDDDTSEPPSPASINWVTPGDGLFVTTGVEQTFRFRTAADGEIAPAALMDFATQSVFDPGALVRYLLGFDPDVAGPHHFLEDPLMVHFEVEWIQTLLARYGYSLELSVRRTDPDPQPPDSEPLELIQLPEPGWFPLPPHMRDRADWRLGEALVEAPCLGGPVPEGATASLNPNLEPRAEYDLVVTADHDNPDHRELIARGHFSTSRYSNVSELVQATGFTVVARDGTPVDADPNPFHAIDVLATSSAPTDVQLADDRALDAALALLGMDPWPLPTRPGTVVIWYLQADSWHLAGVLLDSDESMMRPAYPASLLGGHIDPEQPPLSLIPPRMALTRIRVHEPDDSGGAVLVPRRSNAAGTRVLLVPDAPIDLVGMLPDPETTFVATLEVTDRTFEFETQTFTSINIDASRFINALPNTVLQEEA